MLGIVDYIGQGLYGRCHPVNWPVLRGEGWNNRKGEYVSANAYKGR